MALYLGLHRPIQATLLATNWARHPSFWLSRHRKIWGALHKNQMATMLCSKSPLNRHIKKLGLAPSLFVLINSSILSQVYL